MIRKTRKARKDGRKYRRKDGRKDGRTEGSKEGRKEGRKEARNQLSSQCKRKSVSLIPRTSLKKKVILENDLLLVFQKDTFV